MPNCYASLQPPGQFSAELVRSSIFVHERRAHMPEGAKGTASDVYVLDVGESGAARLRLLDQVYGASTRRMLIEAGLREGSRGLEYA
jgi:hypothetical protein